MSAGEKGEANLVIIPQSPNEVQTKLNSMPLLARPAKILATARNRPILDHLDS